MYELIAYGSGEVLEQVFQAIAALVNGKSGTLYQPLIRLGLMVGLMASIVSVLYNNRAQFLTHWMMPFYLILTFFFAPTTTLMITDPVLNTKYVIENVPWGLGAMAGTVSKIGDSMTRRIEGTFSLPDYLPYHKTGSVMASKIIAQLPTFQITNPDLKDTLHSFVTQCVVYEAMMGRKYTLDDLKHSPNLWQLVTQKASQARAFLFKKPGSDQKAQIMSCEAGAKNLDDLLNREVKNGFQYYGDRLFGLQGRGQQNLNPSDQIRQYLPGALSFMIGLQDSAEDVLRQQMMRSAVVEGIQDKASELGAGHAFAIERAYQHQRAAKKTLAGVASTLFLGMKNAMEALIYASFIFLLPLAVLPLGWRFLSRWAGLVLWIQLWPPLYAILNLVANMALQNRSLGHGALKDGTTGLTLANSIGLANLHADMAAHAGFMSLAVGSLAYALVRGGAASFVHLAGHLSGPATSAAGRSTDDLMSGNYAFGNLSQGTLQAHNTTFGQEVWSPSYTGGSFSQNNGDRTRVTSLGGSQIISVSTSDLRSSLNWSESLTQSYSEQGQKSAQQAENSLRSAATSDAEGYRQLLDYSTHQAHNNAQARSWSGSETSSTSKAFSTLEGLTQRFAAEHNISSEKSKNLLATAQASVEGGFGFSVFGSGLKTKASLSASTNAQLTESDKDLFTAARDFTQQKNFQDALQSVKSHAYDHRYSEGDETGKRLVEGAQASFDHSQQYRTERNQHLSQAESYAQMATWAQQNAGALNENLNQAYVDWLVKEPLPHAKGPMGLQEAETILSSRPDLNRAYQRRFLEEHTARESSLETKRLPTSQEDLIAAYQNTTLSSPITQDSFKKVRQDAAHTGLDKTFQLETSPQKEVQQALKHVQETIEEQTDTLTKESRARKALVQGKTG